MQKNHFLLLKKFKNTGSAQLCVFWQGFFSQWKKKLYRPVCQYLVQLVELLNFEWDSRQAVRQPFRFPSGIQQLDSAQKKTMTIKCCPFRYLQLWIVRSNFRNGLIGILKSQKEQSGNKKVLVKKDAHTHTDKCNWVNQFGGGFTWLFSSPSEKFACLLIL